MPEKFKANVMDATRIRRVLDRMATEILERNRNLRKLVIIGIRTRGVPLAKRIGRLVKDLEGVEIPLGVMDITRYRDDVTPLQARRLVRTTKIPFPVENKDVILVDDVLFTGRTIRAAMDSLFDLGRANTVQPLVLVDRGHRELPIRADYVGKVLPTSHREHVQVRLKELDGRDEVLITEPAEFKSRRTGRRRSAA